MGLLGNHSVLNKSFQRTYGGSALAIANHMNNKASLMSSSILRQRGNGQFKKAAIPTGYGGGSAIMIPWSTGELGVQRVNGAATVTATALSALIAAPISIAGLATVVGNANAIGLIELAVSIAGLATVAGAAKATSSLTAAVAGVATVGANLGAIIPIAASSTGVASAAVNLKGTNRLAGVISIGASGYLSNDDVERLAAAISALPIETGYSLQQSLRLVLSALAGKVSGGGTTTISIRDLNDTVDRIVATVDTNGNRTAVTKDVT